MTDSKTFQGDKKLPMNSFLAGAEKKLIASTVGLFPHWIEGYHLTLMTLVWSAGLIGFGWLARADRHWLWLSSLMIFLQWFTDSYDGALGRLRDTGIPKWGYYMDHLLDHVFLCSVFIGWTFLLDDCSARLLYVLVLICTVFMSSSYLSFAATNEFKITYLGFGPTEMRIIFILLNTGLIFFGTRFLETALPYLIPISVIVLGIIVFRTQKYIWGIDMKEKQAGIQTPTGSEGCNTKSF
jgi:phosphatidylglycerophosphate synthase